MSIKWLTAEERDKEEWALAVFVEPKVSLWGPQTWQAETWLFFLFFFFFDWLRAEIPNSFLYSYVYCEISHHPTQNLPYKWARKNPKHIISVCLETSLCLTLSCIHSLPAAELKSDHRLICTQTDVLSVVCVHRTNGLFLEHFIILPEHLISSSVFRAYLGFFPC